MKVRCEADGILSCITTVFSAQLSGWGKQLSDSVNQLSGWGNQLSASDNQLSGWGNQLSDSANQLFDWGNQLPDVALASCTLRE